MPTITDYLKYANLQMAAEAFIRDPKTLELAGSGDALVAALLAGNGHASRFPTEQAAEDFAAQWTVVDQRANTGTGFSGTLFRANKDDPANGIKKDDLVISFRSTEFLDDAARDNLATNTDEIKNTGWAWGQIADMEAWYAELNADPSKLQGKSFSVTGYSLGGHLATAFNLLRREDGTLGRVTEVVTFNGAGVGKVNQGSLTEAIANFQYLREHPDSIEACFSNPKLLDFYRTLRTNLAVKAWSAQDGEQQLADFCMQNGILLNAPDADRMFKSLSEIKLLQEEAERVKSLKAGGGDNPDATPIYVSPEDIEAVNLDYRMAVHLAAERTEAANLIGGASRAVTGKRYLSPPLTNQYDVVADTMPSMVANSQWHYGTDVRVAIEDQPEYRGTVIGSAIATSWDHKDPKLLVNGYAQNDFGDTHSLVLLVDSLSLMEALKALDPTLELNDFSILFKAASASKVRSEMGTQGQSEGDSLEFILDALHELIVGTDLKLRKSQLGVDITAGNTWANTKLREPYFNTLDALLKNPKYQTLRGSLTIDILPTQSSSGITSKALGGGAEALAYRYAIREANPFAVLGFDYATLNQSGELDLYDKDTGAGELTEQYLNDRAKYLGWKNIANIKNLTVLKEKRSAVDGAWHFHEYGSDSLLKVEEIGVSWSDSSAHHVIFGDDNGTLIRGNAKNDYLYGGGGDDHVVGDKGNDYLEGNLGEDILVGGEGRDKLLGGKGDDRLEGGKEGDTLEGGLGNDTYVFKSGDGWDWVRDQDGSGKIEYDGQVLGQTPIKKIGSNLWEEKTGGVTYIYKLVEKTENGETFNELVIQFPAGDSGDAGGVWINRWVDGQLGISLPASIEPLPTINFSVVSEDGQGTGASDWIPGAAGVTKQGMGGDDIIEGGNYEEATKIQVFEDWRIFTPSAALNNLFGGAGDDQIFADYKVDLTGLDGFENWGGQSEADPLGDVLVGGLGDDILFGDDRHNVVWGGGDDDILVGGGGEDVLLGDQDVIYDSEGKSENLIILFDQSGDTFFDCRFIVRDPTRPDNLAGNYPQVNYAGGYYLATVAWNWLFNKEVVHSWGFFSRLKIQLSDSDGDDSIFGGNGRDYLHGLGGDDVLYGENGDDFLCGHSGDDRLIGGDGSDYITGEYNNGLYEGDVRLVEHGNDLLDGGDGDDHLQGEGGSDVLLGGSGQDCLYGDGGYYFVPAEQQGDDYLDGGDGDDSLHGGGGSDELYGGQGSDYLEGDGFMEFTPFEITGDDILDGGEGNDTLVGMGGADFLAGGQGDDRLFGDSDDTPELYQGEDTLDGGGGKDTIRGYGGDDLLAGGDDADDLFGDEGNDIMSGDSGDDMLDAGSGNDFLDGGAGDDDLFGGDGNDYLGGGGGNDYLEGGAGDDSYEFGGGSDTINDAEGINHVSLIGYDPDAAEIRVGLAGDGKRYLQLDFGNGDILSVVDGDVGSVRTYDFGSQILTWDELVKRLDEQNTDGRGNGHVSGTDGADVLGGIAGDDTIIGHAGNDTLMGRGGNNLLLGGEGQDTYVLGSGMGRNNIVESDAGVNRLRLDAGVVASDFVASRTGDDLVLQLMGGADAVLVSNYFTGEQTWLVEFGNGDVMSLEDFVEETSRDAETVDELRDRFVREIELDFGAQNAAEGFVSRGDGSYVQTLIRSTGDTIFYDETVRLMEIDSGVTQNTLEVRNYSVESGGHWVASVQVDSDIVLAEKAIKPQTIFVPLEGGTLSEYSYSDYSVTRVLAADGVTMIGYLLTPIAGATPDVWVNETHESREHVLRIASHQGSEADDALFIDTDSMPGYMAVQVNGALVDAGAGNDIVQVYSEQFDRVAYSAIENRRGSFLYGNDGDDVLRGGDGADVLVGGQGVDFLDGGFGGDRYSLLGNDPLEAPRTATPDVLNAYRDRVYADFGITDRDLSASYGDQWVYLGATLLSAPTSEALQELLAQEAPEALANWDALYGDGTIQWVSPLPRVAVLDRFREADRQIEGDYIADSGNDETNYRYWAYQQAGIVDVEQSSLYGGNWCFYRDDTSPSLYAPSLEELRALAESDESSAWWLNNWDAALANGAIRYVPVLPEVELPSGNDYAAVEALYASGALQLDTLELGSGLSTEDIVVMGSSRGAQPELRLYDTTGRRIATVALPTADDPIGTGIELFRFADGTTWALRQMVEHANADHDIAAGNADDDLLLGDGNDQVLAMGGDDLLEGGRGNDTLAGGEGYDLYRFNLGDGADVVIETHELASGGGAIVFGAGIASQDVVLVSRGNDLQIRVGLGGDVLTVRDGMADTSLIDRLIFADGDTWDASDIQAHVVAGNQAPVVALPIAGQGAAEDQVWSFQIPAGTFADPDFGDTLTLSASLANGDPLPVWLSFDAASATFSGLPTNDHVGSLQLKVVATDSYGDSVSTEFEFSVSNENDAPLVTAFTRDLTEDWALQFTQSSLLTAAAAQDIDPTNDVLEVVGVSNAINGTVELDQWHKVMFTPDANFVGAASFDFTIADGQGGFTTRTATITVTPENDAPVLNVMPLNQHAVEGKAFEVVLPEDTFADVDQGDSLLWSATLADDSALPAWLSFDAATRTLSGVPDGSAAGVLDIRITVTDSGGASASTDFAMDIANQVLGTAAAETLTGTTLRDYIEGLAGNDTLNGGAEADTLVGGLGNDVYFVDQLGDTVVELAGEGTDRVQTTLNNYVLADNVENLTLSGAAALNGTGNALNNSIVGTSAANVLIGAGGNDTLNGGANADTLMGGSGDDIYVVDNLGDVVIENPGEGNDTVQTALNGYVLGAELEKLTLTGSIAVSGFGNDLANLLTGNSIANILSGGEGNDTLNGGTGADTLIGGLGNDTYIVDNIADVVTENADEGVDTVQTALDGYALGDHLENLTLTGSAAINGIGNALDNVLTGNSVANSLSGGEGNDTLNGGAGVDTLIGGLGNDVYVVTNAGEIITENADEGIDLVQSSVTHTLAANVENLTLTGASATSGTGNALDNILLGNSANNTLDGGSGADTLAGGAGNDTYVVDNVGDVVTENSDEGTDLVKAGISYALGANLENLTLTGTDAIDGTGNALNNRITGNTGNNILDGAGGMDTLIGGAGNDTYYVSTGDTVTEASAAGTDTVIADVNWTLASNIENLTLVGDALNGSGNTLNNVITGNAWDNLLNGGSGADTLIGGLGNDTYTVDNAGDVVTEAVDAGYDIINSTVTLTMAANVEALLLGGTSAIGGTGNADANLLRGNTANNALNGGAGNDILEGGAGNDTLTDTNGVTLFNGGAGTDILTGGAAAELYLGGIGNDTLTTGAGNDLILFNKGDGQDTFAAGGTGNDTLSLGGNLNYADLTFSKSSNDLVLKLGGTDQITFKNWYAATPSRPLLNLQVVAEAMAGFDQAGSNPLLDDKIESFNFAGLVADFDAARSANPTLTQWNLISTLGTRHLSGSDTAAIGGDLAYQYGKNGNLSNVGMTAAQALLSNAAFGTSAQALQSAATLEQGVIRLS